MKKGLNLDRVVLLGRTMDEYVRYFALDVAALRGRRILDVASGVSSFAAEAVAFGLSVTAFDPIYDLSADTIEGRCEVDLEHVLGSIGGLKVYKWDFYQNPEKLRLYRQRAWQTFIEDYRTRGVERYVPGLLPRLPFQDEEFDMALVSYFLFVYQDHFDYEFHRDSILELARVTRGEVRIYPIVTFEGERSVYLDQLAADSALNQMKFEEVKTDFEFLVNSNWFLKITRR